MLNSIVIFVKKNLKMKHSKIIQLNAVNGAQVIIFIDKITHIFTMDSNKTMIKLISEEGILTDLSLNNIMSLINEANGEE
jgi:hypothetical protein